MEWMYRLLREPRRLLKRYSWDLLVFFGVCLRNGRRLG
jgi:beta-1,4-glucosyltransferase